MRPSSIFASRSSLSCLSLAALATLMLAGCASDQPPAGSGSAASSPPLVAGGAAGVYALNYGTSTNTVVNVPVSATAAVSLTLPTGFMPSAIAFDPNSGAEYVAGNLNYTTDEILVYPANATSLTTPSNTILGVVGSATNFDTPYALAVDKNGQLYVLSDYGVNVYANAVSSTGTPATTIYGANTYMTNPQAIAVDSAGSIYVANADTSSTSSIEVFAAASNGNVTPVRRITYSGGTIVGVAVDTNMNVWTTEEMIYTNSVTNVQIAEYAAGATGAATPVTTIAGLNTGLSYVGAIALDKVNNVYTLNYNANAGTFAVLGFAPTASGNVAPAFNSTVSALTNPETIIAVR